ncbi:DUF2971 domain-containing protein [Rubellimicrobium rubrum]|uniref:DUF2971 domain-containing protein n=1 Tax=Rubellimicrobium rubrum TaxID=2585369 RepID=A0A5C4N0F8_9RHOB|nr:DUF2971 domain-containing protein [Rubellimicrobium rubrum]TNC52023.1 DUF2971 domain-containing protein [Rubellimicrobium rubrum]
MKLYKYLSFPRIDVLQGMRIRLTQPQCFNDPFDLRPSFQLLSRDDIEQLPLAFDERGLPTGGRLLTPDILKTIFEFALPTLIELQTSDPSAGAAYSVDNNQLAQNALGDQFGVLSLSSTHDNLLMWAHYAQDHTGFVVELDSSHSFFHGEELVQSLPRLSAVEYSDTRPVLSVTTIHHPAAFLRKSNAWSYEQEWRLIRPLNEASDVFDNGGRYPICLFSLPPEAVTAVFTGVQMLPENYQELTSFIADDPRYRHVRVHHMSLSSHNYRLLTSPPLPGAELDPEFQPQVLSARPFSV